MARWGIVGFGWVARDFMAPAIAAAGDQVVAICDPSPAARQAAERLGAAGHAELPAFLAEPLDMVYVATPNHLHRPAVEACLQAGVPVLCEKPMAATIDDAEAMVAAARRTGTMLGIAFDQRHHPAHRAIRRALVSGMVGTPTAIRIVYACWLDSDWRSGAEDSDNWRVDVVRAGGGATIDLAPHGLDLASMILGEPIVDLAGLFQQGRVQAYAVDDGGMLVARSASGVLVSLHNSYNTPETLPRRRLEIVGTRGQIVALDTMGQDPGGDVCFIDASTGETTRLAFDRAMSPFTEQARAFSAAVRGLPHEYSPQRDLEHMRLLCSVTASLSRPLETV